MSKPSSVALLLTVLWSASAADAARLTQAHQATTSAKHLKTTPMLLAAKPPKPRASSAPPTASAANLGKLALAACPLVGTLTANALYLAPLPAVRDAVQRGAIGQLNPLPWAITFVSTVAWLMYAFAIANPFIVASNLPGAVAAVWMTASALSLMNAKEAQPVQKTLVLGTLSALSLWVWMIFRSVAAPARIAWLGNYATALCVILFASPLSTVGRVLKERSAASIYAPSAVFQAVNGALWTAYGLFGIGDVYVWGPNATGLGLALLMLALKLVFPGPGSKVV